MIHVLRGHYLIDEAFSGQIANQRRLIIDEAISSVEPVALARLFTKRLERYEAWRLLRAPLLARPARMVTGASAVSG